MKIIKTILLFICAISSTSAFLGGIFATITILRTANFVSGKAIVIGICMLLIFLFGLFAILCYRKLYLLFHNKQKEPLNTMKKFVKYFLLGIWTLYCVLGIINHSANYGLGDWIIVILITLIPYLIMWCINHKSRKNRVSTEENNPAPEPTTPEIVSNHIDSTSTNDSHIESESVVSKSDEPQNMQYVETGTTIHRTDGKCITDEEIPYLIRNEQAVATANWKVPSLIRQITESYQIICQTNDPETLCTRYNFIVDKVNELARFEQQGLLDKNIFSQYESLITDDNHYKLISSCYHKYKIKAQSELKTQNGINKRIDKFWEIIRNNVSTEFYNTDWIH